MAKKTYSRLRIRVYAFSMIGIVLATLTLGWFLLFSPKIEEYFKVNINAPGHLNGLIFLFLVAWGCSDLLVSRRRFYNLSGFVDPPLRHWLRYTRLFLILLCVGGGVVAYVVAVSRPGDFAHLPVFGILVSAFIAALGIVITNRDYPLETS